MLFVFLQGQYLPTMPSDNYEEIFNARPGDGTGWVAHSNIFSYYFVEHSLQF